MSMGPTFELETGNAYAEALKQALLMRRAGAIDGRTSNVLGRLLQNIGRCAACEMVREGKLKVNTRREEDFDLDCSLYAVQAANKADLDRTGKEIFCFIRNAVKNMIRNRIRYSCAKKRIPVDKMVAGTMTTMTADFYGTLEQ